MTESCIGGNQNCRSLCWDEQNRLQGVKDNKWLSYYQYDAAGDRTYKLTGKGDLQNINGELRYFYHLENATLYASPYLVATRQDYTKHYYAESERIASRIGGGRLSDLDQPVVGQGKIIEKKSANKTHAKEVLEVCLDARWYDVSTGISDLYIWRDSVQLEKDCYWYHPDHLGSSSWITDSAGTAVQHLHYLPWGEDFVDQRLNSFDGVRFTFSAKERDPETGLSYFGSRYYSSDLSVWLSVNPMSDKYPYQSGYVYCGNNPIKVVDPNGEDEWDLEKDGTLSQRPNGRTDVDIIHAKDKNGNNIERYYKAGTINYRAQCDEKYDNGVGWFTSDMMEFKDVETAMDFFEFAANNSDVEWALKISPTKNFVGTSHDPGFAKIDSPEGMTYDIHSHIDDPNKYMGSDHWRAMEYYNKGVTFNVYEVGKQSYATYNPTSFRLDGPRVISMLLEKKISLLKLILR